MKMNLLQFLVAVVLIHMTCADIKFIDCGSKEGKISAIKISGCVQAPCMLKRNTNVTFSVTFKTNEAVTKATSVVHGIIADIPVPFPIDHPDACTQSGLTCPLKSGSMNTYGTYIFVKPEFPKMKVPVKWELKDQKSNDVFCMVVLTQITD